MFAGCSPAMDVSLTFKTYYRMKRFLFLSLMLMTVGIMWSSENAPVPGVAGNQTRDDVPYETPAPVLSYELTDYAMIFTATGEGTVTLYIQYIDNWSGAVTNEQYSGYGTVTLEVPRDYETTYVNVWASAQANDDAVPGVIPVQYYIEIPALEMMPPQITPCPEFTIMDTGEGILVSATGEGYICLYLDDILVAEGYGSAYYFMPYSDEPDGEEYVFSASAQIDDWEMSEYIYYIVFVPGAPQPYETPVPVLQYDLTDDAMYFTASGEGTVTLYIQFIDNATGEMTTQSVSGEEIVVYAIPRDYEDTYVNVWATAQADEYALIGTTQVEYYVEIPAMVTVVPGDADGDGKLSVTDVTAIIDYVLSNDASGINLDAADFNNDGRITIADVTDMIDYIISNP